MIRYFMTIPEAVSLVLHASAMAHGGEIFVLDMGAPVRILTLAENLIAAYGKRPYFDVKIRFIGLRPGRKNGRRTDDRAGKQAAKDLTGNRKQSNLYRETNCIR